MKNLSLLSLFVAIAGMLSCEQEGPFVCEKNAVVNIGEPECAFARVERTSGLAPDITSIELGLSWSSGGLDLSITSDTPLEEETYTLQDGASFWFNQLNRRDAVTIIITKIDKENNTISGTFDVVAEGNSNSQAYNYIASGSFTDVSY